MALRLQLTPEGKAYIEQKTEEWKAENPTEFARFEAVLEQAIKEYSSQTGKKWWQFWKRRAE